MCRFPLLGDMAVGSIAQLFDVPADDGDALLTADVAPARRGGDSVDDRPQAGRLGLPPCFEAGSWGTAFSSGQPGVGDTTDQLVQALVPQVGEVAHGVVGDGEGGAMRCQTISSSASRGSCGSCVSNAWSAVVASRSATRRWRPMRLA